MNNENLQFVEKCKYLGVILDNKFNFKHHIDYVIEKATKLTYRLSSIAKNTWGLKSNALRHIYIGAIEPIITYCSSIFSQTVNKKYVQNKLLSFQRLIALRIIKSYRTISGDAALILANLIPIDLKLIETANSYYAKKGYDTEIMNTECIEKPMKFYLLPHPALLPKINTNLEENSYKNCNFSINIYTDGSKTESQTGAAFTVYKQNTEIYFQQFKLHFNCSVFQAELLAIEKALNWIKNSSYNTEIGIFSDSKSALQVIKV
jgi:hypothetical protein